MIHRVAVLCILASCASESEVTVKATLFEDQPIEGVEFTVLPFDPDRLLDSLAAAADRSIPSFPELEVELATYRLPDLENRESITAPWSALYDSVTSLADSLNGMDRRAPAYTRAYARFRDMYARLARQTATREEELRRIGGTERQLALSARAAAESVRTWEGEAYAAYPELAQGAAERSGREVTQGETEPDGQAHLQLAPGSWWLVARWPDPANPFQEYSWTVRFATTGWLPLTIPLWEANTQYRWRH